MDRFLRLGRIGRYPAKAADRREFLAWIVSDAIQPGEDLTEGQVNERVLSYTNDVVLLRRYLVDFGLLERTRVGILILPAGLRAGQVRQLGLSGK